MHSNSKLLFEKYCKGYFMNGLKVLEIGPDKFPSSFYEIMGKNPSITWDTIDIYDSSQLTYKMKSENEFPIPDGVYDIVLSANVIEHVRKPWTWLKEVNRVMKHGGKVITINPISWVFHEVPLDCWRIYPDGMKALYEDAGFSTELAKFEHLEFDLTPYRRIVQGCSKPFGLAKRIFMRITGWPFEYVVDGIGIGTKIKDEKN